jgi:hypothetical protein
MRGGSRAARLAMPMSRVQQRECGRVQDGDLLALANSVWELYCDADLADVEAGELDLALQVVSYGFAALTAARIDGALVVASSPVVEEAGRLKGEYGEGPRWLPAGVDAVVCVVGVSQPAGSP